MMNFNKSIFLEIKNQKQLDTIIEVLDTAFEMNNNMALDDVLYNVEQAKNLVALDEENMQKQITKARDKTSENMDKVISIRDLQHALKVAVTLTEDENNF